MRPLLSLVIPAEAGIQLFLLVVIPAKADCSFALVIPAKLKSSVFS
jgi:hypothetical protein